MSFSTIKNYKIGDSIICFYFVNMVDNLIFKQDSSKVFFNIISMFSNSTSDIARWMFLIKNISISIPSLMFSTIPKRMILSREICSTADVRTECLAMDGLSLPTPIVFLIADSANSCCFLMKIFATAFSRTKPMFKMGCRFAKIFSSFNPAKITINKHSFPRNPMPQKEFVCCLRRFFTTTASTFHNLIITRLSYLSTLLRSNSRRIYGYSGMVSYDFR